MSELKPKNDRQLAGDARMNKTNSPQPTKPAKVEGDKFQDAFDDPKKPGPTETLDKRRPGAL